MIVIVSDAAPPQINGVVTTIGNTVLSLRQRGHSVELITPDGCKTMRCPFYSEINIAISPNRHIAARLGGVLALPGAHHIHIVTEGPLGLAARNYLVRRRMHFTTSYHTDFPQYLWRYLGVPPSATWQALRWFHRAASRVLVSTPSVKRELRAQGFAKLADWSRGINLDIFVEGIPEDPPILLYGGRVAKEKSIDAFLRLDVPGHKVVAGAGPYLSVLRARYPHVTYLGKVSQIEMARWMGRASVFVFPSRTDTFGIVMAEANACGTPVAAFPVRGPIDVVRPAVTGFLDADLGQAVRDCLSLDRREVAAYARRNFSWQQCTRQFLANLCEAQSGKAGAALEAPSQIEWRRPATAEAAWV